MNAGDLIPFDPAIIPWPTHVSDWALCLTVDPKGRVWVEHELIHALLEAKHLDHYMININSSLTEIGDNVAKLLERFPALLKDGYVCAIKFANNPVCMRIGLFDGETFVFLPKPEFEPELDQSDFFKS